MWRAAPKSRRIFCLDKRVPRYNQSYRTINPERFIVTYLTYLVYFEHTQTSLTSILYNFCSSIIFFSSTVDNLVSLLIWSTYFIAGFPLFLVPGFQHLGYNLLFFSPLASNEFQSFTLQHLRCVPQFSIWLVVCFPVSPGEISACSQHVDISTI